MADRQISELVEAVAIEDNDLLVLQQGETAKKAKGKTVKDWVYNESVENFVIVSDTEPTTERNHIWVDPSEEDIVIPTMDDLQGLTAEDISYDGSATHTSGSVGEAISELSSDIDGLDAGDVEYDSSTTYASGSVGSALATQSEKIDEVKTALKLDEWTPISAIKHSNGYIKATDGTVTAETATDVFYTEYVDVSSYLSIKYRMILTTSNVYTYTIGIAFYDANKTYVTGFKGRGGQSSGGYQEDIVDVPNGAVYARFTGLTDTTTYGQFYVYGISNLHNATSVAEYFVVNKNLFDKTQATQGKYIATNNGSLVNYSTTFVSDYIPIRRGNTYSYRVAASLYGETAAKRLVLYDSNKTLIGISATGTLSDDIVTVTIEKDSSYYSTGNIPAYCRFTDYIYRMDSTMFVKGTYPSKYYEYGTDLLSDNFGLNDKQVGQIQKITNAGALYGKKIAYNGDSIAESRLQDTNANNGGAYAKIIADLTGCTYENRAASGGILASAPGDSGSTPSRCVVSDVTNMASDADLICFEGGINDYWRDVPLGTYSESDYTGTLDTTTICGALESIFRQAIEKWVGKPICFVITHKITSTVYTQNTQGYDWRDVHEKIVGICRKYAIPYYDAFEESGLNAYNSIQNTNFLTSNSSGTPDGCHPNANGYQKYYVPQLIALFNSIMPRN